MVTDGISRFEPGTHVVWRDNKEGGKRNPDHSSFAMPAIVVADETDAIALFHPPGSVPVKRTGTASIKGPKGPRTHPDDWDGGYRNASAFEGCNVRLQVRKDGYSVLRNWDPEAEKFTSWYVNLELPWRRARRRLRADGARPILLFDSADLFLDIVVEDDLSGWHWKDEDEVLWATKAGLQSPQRTAFAEGQAKAAIAALEAGRFPFVESEWERFSPPAQRRVPQVPAGWSDVPLSDWSDVLSEGRPLRRLREPTSHARMSGRLSTWPGQQFGPTRG